ncbi:MAG TPA: hypothetical protein VFB66_02170, partial [Tepidisphaeraceae bacterium]|nr:hypothetical protein [Tepidisphaeraceae bacterium]
MEGLADEAVRVLKDPAAHRPLGEAARRTIQGKYSLDVSLPKIKSFFEDVAAKGRHGPSVLAERLVRPGTLEPVTHVPKRRHRARPWSEARKVEPCWVPEVVCGEMPAAPFSRNTGFQPVSPLTKESVRHGVKTRDTRKTVLFCWELGAGLGHMLPMLPLAEGLAKDGHHVFVALRMLTTGAAEVFGRAGVSFLQAPLRTANRRLPVRTHNLTDILCNVGWGSDDELFVLGCAWRNLMRQIRPDLVLFDYSPTAMLASRALGDRVRRVVTGLGFFCPPDISPFPSLVEGLDEKGLRRLEGVERQVLGRANRLLRHWRCPEMDRLSQLYADADETFLQTFAELDHYGEHRPLGTEYYGPSGGGGGKPPVWPEGDGRRVYAYLKDFPGLEELLRVLAGRGDRTIVFADNIPAAKRRRMGDCTNIRFEDERLDLEAVGRECDLAVLNANHGTLCRLLLAGRPMLLVPLTLEQSVLARRVCALGAGEVCPQGLGNGEVAREKIERLATDGAYRAAAADFARRHAFDRGELRREMLDRVTALVGP